MSKPVDPSDPMCKHEKVILNEKLGQKSWNCEWCGLEFVHFDIFDVSSARLEPMEPRLTVRDQFAMAALTGLLANVDAGLPGVQKIAYEMADRMMKERGK